MGHSEKTAESERLESTEIYVERFKPDDLRRLEASIVAQTEKSYIDDEALRWLAQYEALTIRDAAGNVLACFGFSPHYGRVWDAWLYGSERLHKMPHRAVRVSRRIIDCFMEREKVARLQIAVNAHILGGNAVRFARLIGFEGEGVLRRYGLDGSDYIMMSRIPDEQPIQKAESEA